jgi:hypothetical protein
MKIWEKLTNKPGQAAFVGIFLDPLPTVSESIIFMQEFDFLCFEVGPGIRIWMLGSLDMDPDPH